MVSSRFTRSRSSSDNLDASASRVKATSVAKREPRSASVVLERSSTRAINPLHLSRKDSTLGNRSMPWSPAVVSCVSEALISISRRPISPRKLTCSAFLSRASSLAVAWAVSRLSISLPVKYSRIDLSSSATAPCLFAASACFSSGRNWRRTSLCRS